MRHWMQTMWGKLNNRRTLMSLLAIGAGITAIGVTRRRGMKGNVWRNMLPFRKMARM